MWLLRASAGAFVSSFYGGKTISREVIEKLENICSHNDIHQLDIMMYHILQEEATMLVCLMKCIGLKLS